jgi:hypothetical protein
MPPAGRLPLISQHARESARCGCDDASSLRKVSHARDVVAVAPLYHDAKYAIEI